MTKTDTLKNILDELFPFFGISPVYSIEEKEDAVSYILIEGDDLSFLIGKHGRALDAMQTLIGQMLFNKLCQQTTVIVDINGYRESKIEKLQDMARRCIDRVRFFEREVALPPMTPWERKQIHTYISEYGDVVSESNGVGEARRVVIKPNK